MTDKPEGWKNKRPDDSYRHREARFGRKTKGLGNPFSPKYPKKAKQMWRDTAEDAGGTFVPESDDDELPYEPRFEAEILSQSSIEDLTDKELGERIRGAEKMVARIKKEGVAQELADAKYYLSMLKVEAESRGRRVRVQDPDSGKVEYLTRL